MSVLEKARTDYEKRTRTYAKRVIICAGTGCIANGALTLYEKLTEILKRENMAVDVELNSHADNAVEVGQSGCQGFCQMGPLINIEPLDIMYLRVTPADVEEIVEKSLKKNDIVPRLLYRDPETGNTCRGKSEIPFYRNQHRLALKLCGGIDAGDIGEYIYRGGYVSAEKCMTTMSPEEICALVTDAGLRGRGGAGFPTGKKWDMARVQPGDEKYVICNGDEGDPGAFMDRSVMEGNPHAVIEGMMIAARGIGAHEGYIYVRAEYPLAVKRMIQAVRDAGEMGILGDNCFGTGYGFTLTVMEGAGAFVCGEETALMASIMGKRGMPSPKPPFPAVRGLRDKPTILNNVETLATIPELFRMGTELFRKTGTPTSAGTKTFALTGQVANTGLIEVPMGTTLREIIYDIGGGVLGIDGTVDNDSFKAVQIGGPSGGCLSREHLDLPLDFDSLKSIGAMVGSGGLVVMNTSTCIVRIARYFMQFTQNESCGKCVPCREGTKQMLLLLDDIIGGRGTEQTLTDLEDLAFAISTASLCGLGKTAPNPVASTLRSFRAEYEAHIFHATCPAGECTALTPPFIDPALCIGCTACTKVCPVNAITGERKGVHSIDPGVCIRCGACGEKCKFSAVKGI